jgi:O-antigen/teichoic acid export membrane protein
MQLLVNSGPLIARADATPSTVEFAGHLLATMTLARVPVFIFQSLQATYLARVTQAAHQRDRARLRRTLTVLAGLVVVVATLTVLAAAAVGPFLVRLIYGESFDIPREAAVLVAVGVALYVLATVANDTNVALGHHPRVALSWLAAVVAGAGTMALTDSLLLRSTLPLIVGSLVAAASLVTGVARTIRELSV